MYKFTSISVFIVAFSYMISFALAEDVTVLKADTSTMEVSPINNIVVTISHKAKGISIKDLEKLYRSTAKCVHGVESEPNNIMFTFVNKLIYAKGEFNNGLARFIAERKTTRIDVYWPYSRSTKNAVTTIKHEFIHVLLFLDGDYTDNNIEHLSPLFKKCL